MADYNANEVEKKWRDRWEKSGVHSVDLEACDKPKYYNLTMFPYPSGDKLHIGHWYNYAPADSHGRYMKMKGFNVLQPMGFDAFGLPAENYAIKTGVHPQDSIQQNVGNMIEQLKRIGGMYDWDKMVNTSQPDYYKWTQWLFLQMYKNGLAYKKKATVNFCPSCQTVLANEQVWDGKCERCKSEVKQKDLEQWFWKTTAYSQRLLDGLDGLDWPEKTKAMQRNWIGRSEGVNFACKVKDMDFEFDVYDSVPQTFMAQTFCVIAPEHSMVAELVKGTEHEKEVEKFVKEIKKKKLANKFDIETDMAGIFTGRYVDNPYGTGDLPIWVASFVVADYGTGIVNCSAHDERDFIFAKKYGIELRPVMFPADRVEAEKVRNLEYCYHHADEGILEQPAEFKGRKWGEAREEIIDYLVKGGRGKRNVNYKLRDWLLSRQRYWGAPIPIVYCEKCGIVAVPESELPVVLPRDVEYKPTGGETSPLATSEDFVNTKCPDCGGAAKREVDTMDTFVCSSWYYLRYLDSANSEQAWSPALASKWMPVDMYIGGPEHACMHLIYARFVMMALHDFGFVGCDEPFKRLVHQGLVTKDGAKMSKSKGNVVSPDSFVEKYGSDVFRMYLMFMGPFTDGGDWNDKGITGIARFVDRFWNLVVSEPVKIVDEPLFIKTIHKLVKRMTKDIENFQFNTAISAMMEFVNFVGKNGIDQGTKKVLARLIAPIAPHLAEECFEALKCDCGVFETDWPEYDEALAVDNEVTLGIQVNGKVRGEILMAVDATKEEALAAARADSKVAKYLAEGKVVKEIYVPGKIIGFVVA